MTPSQLLADLQTRGIRVTVAGERLRVDAPRGALTADLRAKLTANKSQILAQLRQGNLYEVPAGWTSRAWVERLRYLAGICILPTRAAELYEWAEGVERAAGL